MAPLLSLQNLPVLLIILLNFFPIETSAMFFKLSSNKMKCLKEEVHQDVLVTGAYSVKEQSNVDIDIKITDTKDHVLFQKTEISEGKFAFTLDTDDVFSVCFTSRVASGEAEETDVELELKHGVEAKNYDELAKAEQLKPLEMQLRRLEDLTESIVNDFQSMKKREEEMRNTNESTNSRVLYFSVFSMVCLITLALWQVVYLKKWFKTKKLIE